ncbi:hypothetical protein MKX03_027190 [Papaver bracteatum]|nr:hypothetical protein MKX03_027190 [Papaver bracteatum]
MAKPHHPSFFIPLLVGFLLILLVSDMAYVHSDSCYPQGTVELEPGKTYSADECYFVFCWDLQVQYGITYDATTIGWNPETGNEVCICCITG